jgi:hypothetical protein
VSTHKSVESLVDTLDEMGFIHDNQTALSVHRGLLEVLTEHYFDIPTVRSVSMVFLNVAIALVPQLGLVRAAYDICTVNLAFPKHCTNEMLIHTSLTSLNERTKKAKSQQSMTEIVVNQPNSNLLVIVYERKGPWSNV